MARGTTLVKLIDQLRAETRRSLNPAHNSSARDAQVQLLQRVQERLWEDFNWPNLRVKRQMPVQAGQRYYDTPEDMRIDRIEAIDVFRDGRWYPLDANIDDDHYAAWNSDLDARSWPPRRWTIHEDEDIEIWPIPESDADSDTLDGYLRFTGIRNLRRLVQDDDRADIDDRLIVLFAAAEVLAAGGAKDAQLKLDQANALYARLRGSMTPLRKFRMFGIGEPQPPRRLFISQYRPPEG